MKKIFLALGAAMLVMAVNSCKSDSAKTAETESDAEMTEEVADTVTGGATGATAVGTDSVATDTTAVAEAATPAKEPEKKFESTNPDPNVRFLENLRHNDKSVTFTPSGLGYKVIKQGTGPTPEPSNTVKVKYTGKHIDGSVFDSSGDNTIDFPLQGVIQGFSEGIGKMNRGAVYELYIPGNLGYGERGAGNIIGPNETLIFEVELVDFR